MFLFAGATIIIAYGEGGGVQPDGQLPPQAPSWLRVTHLALGLGVVVCMAVIASWIAFGEGPRTFTATSTFGGTRPASEGSGRFAFGVGAVLLYVFFITLVVTSIRRFRAVRK